MVRPKIGDPPPMRESTAGRAKTPISGVHDDAVGDSTDGDRSASWRGGGGESEDGTGHERANGCDREDSGSEDVSPNAHDCLHAFSEVNCPDPGSGGPLTSLSVHQSLADYIS